MAPGAAPDEFTPLGAPEPVMRRGLGLSVALGVVVTIAVGMLQTGLCRGNPACMAIPFSLLGGGGAAGYLAGRRAGLVGALVGVALVVLTVVALLATAASYQRTGRPLPPLPWTSTAVLVRFAASGLFTILFTALGGTLGVRLRRYVERG